MIKKVNVLFYVWIKKIILIIYAIRAFSPVALAIALATFINAFKRITARNRTYFSNPRGSASVGGVYRHSRDIFRSQSITS